MKHSNNHPVTNTDPRKGLGLDCLRCGHGSTRARSLSAVIRLFACTLCARGDWELTSCKRAVTALTLLLFLTAGCASGPARKTLPLPPTPPGMPALSAITKRQTLRVTTTSTVPQDRPIYIYPMFGDPDFGDTYMIVALQKGGGNLEMRWADTITGPWQFLAGYGYYPEDQYVVASIPAHWEPYNRMFVCARNTPSQPPPPAALVAARATDRDTGRTLTVRGQKYRMLLISQPGAQFPLYRLQL